jgi:hypothetical protein
MYKFIYILEVQQNLRICKILEYFYQIHWGSH